MPKRKRDASALDKPLSGSGRGNARGGAGRGQGRKAAPRPFAKAAVARAEQTAPEQKSITELLGMRKKPEAQPTRDVISWSVEDPESDSIEPVEHKQHKHGVVNYTTFGSAKVAELLAKGTVEDKYYVSPIDESIEVDATVDGAVTKTRAGMLKIHVLGEETPISRPRQGGAFP